ncbi:MAG: transcriptional repressor [Chloroflexi bacterium]|nr:transcriptional repressor [Chloroflexota bacterium]
MRRSKARETIIEELQKVKTHPRVDELFHLVRRRMPRISLGTVYRNLDRLRHEGAVAEIFCGDFNRYDGDTSRHHHFLCRRCQRVWDLDGQVALKVELTTQPGDFRIDGEQVLLYGLCRECLEGEGLSHL